MRRTFRSLANRGFRLWFFPGVVSNVGTWMQSTAQSWVVLTELTDGDAVAAGITMSLQLAPQLVLVPISGLVADRLDRRKLLITTQALMMALSVAIGLLLASGIAELWHFYLFALVFGIITALDVPARQTFVSDLVAERDISNAVALNLASHHAARLVGPAAAGVVIALAGSGWVFMLNAVTFLPLLVALLVMRPRDLLTPAPAPRGRGQLAAGFVYVARRSDLRIVLIMLFLLGIFGMNFPLFASTMAVEFGADSTAFGILTSVMAIGSLAGALLSAGRERARLRVMGAGAVLMGVSALAAAFMPDFWSFAITTIVIGLAGVTTFTTANGYVQTSTEPALRGRVMSIYSAVLGAGTPIGAPVIGWVANEFGARWAIGSGILLCGVACAIGGTWYLITRRRGIAARPFWRRRPSPPAETAPPSMPSEQLTLTSSLDLSEILPEEEEEDGPAAAGQR